MKSMNWRCWGISVVVVATAISMFHGGKELEDWFAAGLILFVGTPFIWLTWKERHIT